MHSYCLHLTTRQMLPRYVYPHLARDLSPDSHSPPSFCVTFVCSTLMPTSHPFPNSTATSSRKPSQTSHKPLASLCHTEA